MSGYTDSPIAVIVGLTVLAAIPLLYYFFKPYPQDPNNAATVDQILVFPIKSMGGLSLQRAEITEKGFKYDRQYMLAKREVCKKTDSDSKIEYDDIHNFITMRDNPQMAIVRPSIDEATNELRLVYGPNAGFTLVVPLTVTPAMTKNCPQLHTILWGQTTYSYDIEPLCQLRDDSGSVVKTDTPVADFFYALEGFDYAVTLVSPATRRVVSRKRNGPFTLFYKSTPSYQDYYPGNFITRASLADLNSRIPDPDLKLSPFNFRPNMVLSGTKAAWDEDDWKHMTVVDSNSGEAHNWHVACRNVRCQVPTVSISKGTFHPNREPYKTMQKFRRIDKGSPYEPCFGMNVVNTSSGYFMNVGDKVYVNKRGSHFYIG